MPSRDELLQLQALPLMVKIQKTKQRIQEWVDYFGEEGVYVSFSGGKDSTVLLHIAREMYPNIRAVFCDTGIEYPSMRKFVKGFDNVDWLKPKKAFYQIVKQWGYPMISKELCECVYGARKYVDTVLEKNKILTDRQTDRQTETDRDRQRQTETDRTVPYWYRYEKLLGIGEFADTERERRREVLEQESREATNVRLKILMGTYPSGPGYKRTMFSQTKYQFFLDAPFELSNHCCSVMKKQIAHSYEKKTGRRPITAQTASESALRTQVWLRNGCNAFTAKKQISNPMSFWTEQDVLNYVALNGIALAEPYGEVVVDGHPDMPPKQAAKSNCMMELFDKKVYTLKVTGVPRTGCVTCAYGAHRDPFPGRFFSLYETDPKLYDWMMRGGAFDADGKWKPKGGLGYWFVFKWIMSRSNLTYNLPGLDGYCSRYATEDTEYWLSENAMWFSDRKKQ